MTWNAGDAYALEYTQVFIPLLDKGLQGIHISVLKLRKEYNRNFITLDTSVSPTST